MIKRLLARQLAKFGDYYHYDMGYLGAVLQHSTRAFLKFNLFQVMAAHRQSVPAAPYYAASLRATLAEDCGPCVQLICQRGVEAGVDESVIKAIVAGNLAALDDDVLIVMRFTELVLAHDPAADALRTEIVRRWGEKGLISLGFAISSSRVFPTLKYALGYGHACTRLKIGQDSVAPNRQLEWEVVA